MTLLAIGGVVHGELGDNVVCGVLKPSPFSISLTATGGHGPPGLL